MRAATLRRLVVLLFLALTAPLAACPGGGSTDEGEHAAAAVDAGN